MHLVFYNIPSHGHINPTLPVVEELIRRGHRVTYYAFEEFRAKVERSGADFRAYEGLEHLPEAAAITDFVRLSALLVETARDQLPLLLADLDEDPADAVLHDSLAVWGKLTAAAAGLPAVSSITTFAFNMATTQSSASFLLPILGMIVRGLPTLARHTGLRVTIQRRYGVPAPGMLDSFQNKQPLNVVFTSQELQPHAETFDDSYVFVGPSIGPRKEAAIDFSLERPLIYISMGTLFNKRADFYRRCLQTFGGTGYNVLMSVGKQTDIEALGPIPPNVTVRSFVPQVEVLNHTDLFITHGGMNSVHEALLSSVPMIVLPQMNEQALIARRVDELGAGLHLAEDADLLAAAERILAEGAFQQASAHLGESLQAAGGWLRAADLIEGHLTARIAQSGTEHDIL